MAFPHGVPSYICDLSTYCWARVKACSLLNTCLAAKLHLDQRPFAIADPDPE